LKTQTLHKDSSLLRQKREQDELAIISVSFKVSEGVPIQKWVEVVLVNISDEPLENVITTGAFGVHPMSYIPYEGKKKLWAKTLYPLEEIVGKLELWMDFIEVHLNIEFTRRGKQKKLKLVVGEYPDKDDFESHGIYNLLDPQMIPDNRTCDISNVKYDEILQKLITKPELLKSTTPKKFEEVIAEIYHKFGYQVSCVGKTGDGGVDIYAVQKDDINHSLHLIQCKRYSGKVGVSHIRELYGVQNNLKANKGVLVTTSSFTRGAKEFQEKNCWQIQLIDFEGIKQLLQSLTRKLNSSSKCNTQS